MTTDKTQPFSAPGYEVLAAVLQRAFDQAADGKGKERHANALPFDKQPMQTIAAAHGVGFLTGQAAKKSQEAHGLPHDRAVAEILGAINYLAGAVIFMEAEAAAKAAAENGKWISWYEDYAPALSVGTLIRFKTADGNTSPSLHPSDISWKRGIHGDAIIAYQVANG